MISFGDLADAFMDRIFMIAVMSHPPVIMLIKKILRITVLNLD